jgi:spermidine synthase
VLFGVQSITKKDNSLTGMYYDYAMAAPVMAGIDNKKNADMLILGMGTGTYARECLRYFGNMKTEGVEIDQKITDLAQKYFDEPKNAKVTTYDGRAYLQASDQKYDVIMVDAYQDITIPFQMSTVEFFNMVKEHLKAGGVMVVNMNMRSEEKGNINQYLADTIARVFPEVYTVDVQGYTNRELFAMSGDEKDQGIKQFKKYQSELPDGKMKELMASIGDQMSLYTGGGDILTDDKAPVELLGMHEIDGLIQNEAGYYKGLYHQKGMRGLLKDLGISI